MRRNDTPSAPSRTNPGQPSIAAQYGLRWLCLLTLCLAAGAAYYSSFNGVFLLDDTTLLLSDRFKNLWPPWELLNCPRPVVDVSLAVNYAISGLEPWSYHAFNLTVHALAALTLFGLIRRTMERRPTPNAAGVAFAVALLWAVHPLQTQAVTYVIQRSESMMGLFYLLTLYCFVRGAESGRRVTWYVCAVLACALGMASKAVMVTAPVVALLYDRAFLAPSWREVFQRRWRAHLSLVATWSILALTGVLRGLVATSPVGTTVGFGAHVTPKEYALTQPGVILHYLRLAFWPHPLCLDYAWPVTKSLAGAALPLAAITVLLVATILVWIRRPALGFLGAAFFLTLAPTSSFVPIQDLAVEHRMYLPLASIVLLVALVVQRLLRSPVAATALMTALAIPLAVGTYQRNKVYLSAVHMWTDIITQHPDNARAHNNLAVALLDESKVDQAIEHLDKTLNLSPGEAKAHVTIAGALEKKGRYEEVAAHYREAVRLQPTNSVAHYNLANCLYNNLGQADAAIAEYREAQRWAPLGDIDSYIMLGNLFSDQERYDESANEYRSALAAATAATSPTTLAKAHFNLGNYLLKVPDAEQAIIEYRLALQLNPQHYEAQYGIGVANARMNRLIEAVEAYRAALAINPNYGPAKEALEKTGGPEMTQP